MDDPGFGPDDRIGKGRTQVIHAQVQCEDGFATDSTGSLHRRIGHGIEDTAVHGTIGIIPFRAFILKSEDCTLWFSLFDVEIHKGIEGIFVNFSFQPLSIHYDSTP